MKKLLLASVAVSGLAFAAPAHADIDLNVGGYFKGYGVFTSQDETTGTDVNGFDFIRDTEIHLGGETTLDNGLTVGARFEFKVDGNDTTTVDESYVYFSGDWGRVNFGAEDGAAYLLQVAAPSADSNLDGLRQYVSPFAAATNFAPIRLDYDQNTAGKNDKLTYLSPVMSGVQVGLSFTPDADAADDFTIGTSANTAGATNEVYEIAIRYEGQFQNVGVIAGAGYGLGVEDGSSATTDDVQDWNIGLDLDIGPFGIGAAYVTTNQGLSGTASADISDIVIGVDYTTGPFKIGATYFNQDTDNGTEYDRYTAGVTYEYGPGMSFRGSIQHLEQDNVAAGTDTDGTSLVLGTQINF
ncbi:MAG: porin [Alphaproteobacteria bacterium]|nr:MAG: porin [Alphaproteobacteria bacterium]